MFWPSHLGQAIIYRNHGDAFGHWADMLAQVTADTVIIDHGKSPFAILAHIKCDGLVAGVFTGDVTTATFNT